MMRIFLTGATGYIGSAILERLLATGNDVIALARQERQPGLRGDRHVEWINGTLEDTALLSHAAALADATIHTAAQHDSDMERLDRSAIDAIGEGMKATGKCFITTSATPIYGDTGQLPRAELEPISEPAPSRAWRLQHDRDVIALRDAGIRGVVIRPPLVFGRGAGFVQRLIKAAQKQRLAFYIGDGSNRWSTVHVDHLADLYLRALLDRHASGAFNAASNDSISMRELAETIAEAFGPGITAASCSLGFARGLFGGMAELIDLWQLVSSKRASAELGWPQDTRTLRDDLLAGSYIEQATVVSHNSSRRL